MKITIKEDPNENKFKSFWHFYSEDDTFLFSMHMDSFAELMTTQEFIEVRKNLKRMGYTTVHLFTSEQMEEIPF